MINDPLFYAAAVLAVILVGLAKGGFSGLGLLSLPLMALVVSPVQAAAIMLPILMIQDVVTVWAYRRTWDGSNLARLLPGAALGIVLGWALAAKVSDHAVEFVIGIVSITFALRRLALERGGRLPPAHRPGRIAGLVWGGVSGFTSMVAHAGGPPFQVYVMPQRLPRETFVGTGAMFFAVVNWIKVPPYLALGQLTAENLSTSLALFPLAIAATYAGVWLVRRVPTKGFYTVVYCLLVAVGGRLVWEGATGLAAP